MSATYGLRSSGSSASAALQASLVSKLPELLASRGLTMWQQTWKTQVTPLRRRILAHTASAHRTSDSGSTGWPTPIVQNSKHGSVSPAQKDKQTLDVIAVRAHWPTARKLDGEINESLETWSKRRDRKAAEGINLHFPLTIAAQMATWPTPRREDSESTGAHRGKPDTLHSATQLAGWATPNTHFIDAKSKPPIMEGRKPSDPQIGLADQAVHLAGWQTPLSSDGQVTQGRSPAFRAKATSLSPTECLPGQTLPGSSAATEKPGQLNAAFSLWLMGYREVEWLSAAPFRLPKAVKSASTYLAESAS